MCSPRLYSIYLTLIFSLFVTISAHEMFKKTCNLKEFSMTSPETILPQISTKSRPSDEDILLWYEKGLTECQANYQNKTSGYATEKVGPPLMNRQVNTRNNLCRGNAMLYQTTGLLVWPFGPIDQCSTNSECWFGFLTCGSFQQDKLTELFNSGYQSDPHSSIHPSSFKEWSIKALDITSRIVGLESLVPFVSHVTITANNKHIEVILAQYTLTIPGHYTIEMRLQGLYPGLLYNWKPEDLSKGVEMYHSIFLGGSEGRCPPYVNCGPYNIPLCDVKSLVGNAPYRMKSTHRVVDCPSDKVPSILPLCHGGNNPGRWIRIPDSVLEVCGASKFEKDMKDEHQRQFGKRQDFNKYAAIVTAYAHHTQHLSEDKMWESVKHHSHQSNDNQIYYDILSRYAGGNICALANIEDLPTPLDGRLELFAPYDCKYRLFTSEQGANCLQKKGRNLVTFHGDSMSRNIYAAFMDIMSVSGITPEQLKVLMNSGLKNYSQSAHGLTLSEIYTWDIKDRSIETIRPPLYPPVYITNAALAHSITHDLDAYTSLLKTLPLIQFWRNYQKQVSKSSHHVLKIYQSSSAMHGKRNFGFQWMNEVFRRQNKINREIFIQELQFHDFDEWSLTAAKPDYGDGWHYYSVPLKMNAMILLNMICYLD